MGDLLAEHGLSILIETRGKKILFDTGKSFTALNNARTLGAALGDVDTIVLSHGHYDHTGGLKEVLNEAAKASRQVTVLAHPEVWSRHYMLRKDERPRYVGIPFEREDLESLGAHIQLERGPSEVAEDVIVTGEIPRITPFEPLLENRLALPDGDGWRLDEIPDDQAVVVRTESGLVVVVGCAHSGVINTVEYARTIAGDERVHAIVGGIHLLSATEDQVDQTILALKGLGIERLGVSHCTGLGAMARLAREFGETLFFNNVDTVVDFE